MKKTFLFLLLMLPTLMMAKTKVAVYVTAAEGVEEATKQIVGTELVTALIYNPEYSAVERTSDFLAEIQKEHGYQRSGNVEDSQIRFLGKQFGVDMVCVANIVPFQYAYYIQARLLNVETATVEAAARATSSLSSIDDIVSAAETLASKLVGKQADEKKYGRQFSSVLTSPFDCDIVSIDNTGRLTIVKFKFITPHTTQIMLSPNTFITDKSGKIYKAIGMSGIGTEEQYVNAGITPFSVTFEKIPNNLYSIDIIEPTGWQWKGISLTPYEKIGYYVFEDNSNSKYASLVKKDEIAAERAAEAEQRQREKQAEEAARQQATQENFQNALYDLGKAINNYKSTQNSYILEVHNTKSYDCKIILDKRIVGTINAYKTTEYLIPIDWYGKLQLIQKNGYIFSPTVYNFVISKQKPQSRIKVITQ